MTRSEPKNHVGDSYFGLGKEIDLPERREELDSLASLLLHTELSVLVVTLE